MKATKTIQTSLDSVLRNLLESSSDPIVFYDFEGRLAWSNRAFKSFLFNPEKVLPLDQGVFWTEELDRSLKMPGIFKKRISELTQPTETYDLLEFKDGRTFELRSLPQFFENDFIGRIFYFRNLSRQIQVDKTRSESYEILRCLVEAATEGIVVHDHGFILFVNGGFSRQFGYDVPEIVGKDVYQLITREYQETVADHIAKDSEEAYEFRGIKKDGSHFWGLAHGRKATFMGTKVRVVAVQDITSRKQSEIDLKNSEERLRKIISNTPDVAIETFDEHGRVLSWNPAAEKMYGYKENESIGKTLDQLILNESDHIQFVAHCRHLIKTNQAVLPYLYRVRTKSGEDRVIRSTLFPVNHLEKKIFVCMDIDITETVQAEERLLEALEREQSLHSLLADQKQDAEFFSAISKEISRSFDIEEVCDIVTKMAVPYLADWCFIALLDENKRLNVRSVTQRNQEVEKVKFNELDDCVSQLYNAIPALFNQRSDFTFNKIEPCFRMFNAWGAKTCLISPMKARGKYLGSIAFINNSEKEFSYKQEKIAKEIAGTLGLMIDNVLLYKKAQNGVKEREEFISVASHELKTPLTSLKMQLELISRYLSQGRIEGVPAGTLQKVLSTAQGELERFSKLIQVLLDVSRVGFGKLALIKESTDMTSLVQKVISSFQKELESAGCRILTDLSPGVQGNWDKIRIEQIVINLISNAMKFGAGKPIEVRLWKDDYNQAILTVKDFGIGISKESQNKIFRRFERAVPDRLYSGLGLGLYISHELVCAHGGTISVDSELGKGATFTVRLPME